LEFPETGLKCKVGEKESSGWGSTKMEESGGGKRGNRNQVHLHDLSGVKKGGEKTEGTPKGVLCGTEKERKKLK